MKKTLALLVGLLCLGAPAAGHAGVLFGADAAWQAQFAGAVHWSALGVNDDSGVTDNTAALNALPAGAPIIADCPHGGYVGFTGTWNWPSGLIVWQQPGCWLKSTIVTPGVYPIEGTGGLSATSPTQNVQYYGMNFSFMTPTNQVRVMNIWVDHLKFKYFDFDGTGGGFFITGSDQEIAFGIMTNTNTSPGSPGIRQIGTDSGVAASAGMRANDWYHNLNFQSGDGTFQACQPGNSTTNPSTDGILYENSVGESNSSAVILVNEPLASIYSNYSCADITYRNINGSGMWFADIGDSTAATRNILVSGGSYDGSLATSNLPALGIGIVPYGGNAAASANTSNITISGVTLTHVYQGAIEAIGGVSGLTIAGNTIGTPRVGVGSSGWTVALDGTSNTIIRGNIVAAGNNPAGIALGVGANVTGGAMVSGNIVSGVNNGKAGISLGNSAGATVSGNTISAVGGATSAIGVSLASNPNGANAASVTGNNVSALPTPIVCASGQGNAVTGNAGAADCP